ncbi:MAG: hypothetical protein ISS25_03085 [Nanoarchaeota archaeon]|nr:hypothetical protein [DPANN group archaeon]MBL7116785.1 hypothetical protein [Nanoarchaeota archaeon]
MLVDTIDQRVKPIFEPKKVSSLYFYAQQENTLKLEKFVNEYYNKSEYFDDDEVKVITHFLQYMLLKHGENKRKTGRLYSGHPTDVAKIVVELYEKEFRTTDSMSSLRQLSLPLVRKIHLEDVVMGDELSYLDVIGALLHDVVEETHDEDNPVMPADIKKEFEEFIINSDIEDKDRFLEDAEGLEFIADKLTKYDVDTGEPRDYYEFTDDMIDLNGKKHLAKYIPKVLKIKGGDIIANINELDDLYKDVPSRLMLFLRDMVVYLLGGEEKRRTKKISVVKHTLSKKFRKWRDETLETIGRQFQSLSHRAERDRAITGPEKLLAIYKSFRVVDTINKYLNKEGYEYFQSRLKEDIIIATLGRIQSMEQHLLKYHCAGFKREYLSFDDEKLYSKDRLVIKPIMQIDQIWLEKELRKKKLDTNVIGTIKGINNLYSIKDLNQRFDVLDKIHLDRRLHNYTRAGWLARRTRFKMDERRYPFDILEANYDKFVSDERTLMEPLRGDYRKQYIHLQIFKRLMLTYLNDMYRDRNLEVPKIIKKKEINLESRNKRYRVFGWGAVG